MNGLKRRRARESITAKIAPHGTSEAKHQCAAHGLNRKTGYLAKPFLIQYRGGEEWGERRQWRNQGIQQPVSYTHLTLPTIYSV